MTIKEIAKLLCILAGYDKNIKFESNSTDDISKKYYKIEAEDGEDNYISADGFGTIEFLSNILDEIKSQPHHDTKFWLNFYSIKDVLNDEFRNINQQIEDNNLTEIKETSRLSQPFFDWIKQNNPCPNCTINTKDHWDDIHYNCEKFHTMSCPILWEFMNKRDEMQKSLVTDTPEYKEVIQKYREKDTELYDKLKTIKK